MESEECQIMGLEGFVLVEQREIVAKLMIKRFTRWWRVQFLLIFRIFLNFKNFYESFDKSLKFSLKVWSNLEDN